jgi:hypothetical protein
MAWLEAANSGNLNNIRACPEANYSLEHCKYSRNIALKNRAPHQWEELACMGAQLEGNAEPGS